MTITTVGIDLAKNVFAVHGVDQNGKTVLIKSRVTRTALPGLIAGLPPCVIGMEACSGAHYWARLFRRYGHEPRLMAAKFVSPLLHAEQFIDGAKIAGVNFDTYDYLRVVACHSGDGDMTSFAAKLSTLTGKPVKGYKGVVNVNQGVDPDYYYSVFRNGFSNTLLILLKKYFRQNKVHLR